jgi:hypothetical protein
MKINMTERELMLTLSNLITDSSLIPTNTKDLPYYLVYKIFMYNKLRLRIPTYIKFINGKRVT